MINLRASSIGSCPTALLAELIGMKALSTSERMQGLYDRGNAHETDCITALNSEGWDLDRWTGPMDEGQPYVAHSTPQWALTGHLDGIGLGPGENTQRVVEIKAPSTWASFERAVRTDMWTNPYMVQIAWQVSTYMALTGLECVMACVDDGRLKTFTIETPPIAWDLIAARCEELVEDVAEGVRPATCPRDDYGCPYLYLHAQPEVEVDAVLDTIAGEYHHWSAMEKAAKATKDAARDQLLAHGGGVTDSWKVSVSERVTNRYDYAAIEKALGRPLDEFKTESTSKSVRVTKRTSEDG